MTDSKDKNEKKSPITKEPGTSVQKGVCDTWSREGYEAFLKGVLDKADPAYREFHKKLVPGLEHFAGVRIPELRRAAAGVREGNFLEFCGYATYEETVLAGLVIAKRKGAALAEGLEEFWPRVDNWAVCDVVCSTAKDMGRQPDFFLPRVLAWAAPSNPTFTQRAGLVLLLDYFLKEPYLEAALAACDGRGKQEYYAEMAAAWLLSMALVKFPKPTLAFFDRADLTPFVRAKAFQKARESFRKEPLLRVLEEEKRSPQNGRRL